MTNLKGEHFPIVSIADNCCFPSFPGVKSAQDETGLKMLYSQDLAPVFVDKLQELSSVLKISDEAVMLAIHLYLLSRISVTAFPLSYCQSNVFSEQRFLPVSASFDKPLNWQLLIKEIQQLLQSPVDGSKTLNITDQEQAASPVGTQVFFLWGKALLPAITDILKDNSCVVLLADMSKDGQLSLSYHIKGADIEKIQLQQYLDCFGHLITIIAENPDRKISANEIFSAQARRDLLGGSKRKTYDLSKVKNLPLILEQKARQQATQIALVCGERQLSFADLALRVAETVAALQQNQVQSGDKVAVFMSRDMEWALVQLACMCMGAVYVPLDTHYPASRIIHMLDEAEVSWLVTTEMLQSDIQPLCESLPVTTLIFDDLQSTNKADLQILGQVLADTQLAYIQFTSGTTGKPKGAMVEHLGMVNHIFAKINDLDLQASDVVAQTASQCFDVSIWQLLTGLFTGAKTVIYQDDIIWDLDEYLKYSKQQGVIILEVVPSYLDLLMDEIEAFGADALTGLRYLMVTGERITIGQLSRWFAQYPAIPMVNAYGPTEASDDITHFIIDNHFDSEMVPIGFPIHNADIYILDEDLSLLPWGSVGEICVSGICVGRGYINRPIETEKAFVIDPFKKEYDVRLYRTGDYGRWLADGSIEFLGRKDQQVKVMGVRIELMEIEQQMSTLVDVKDVAVIIDGNQLICFYSSLTKADISDQTLRKLLNYKLPFHSIPSQFNFITDMPLNSNGKIDKAELLNCYVG